MRTKSFLGLTVAATLCAAAGLVAQNAQEASAPPPEVLARMQPGPMHRKLEPLIGNFQMTGKYRMTPEQPWQEFKADVERKWILDGRFVEETMQSEWMGQAFEGKGILGYDNVRVHLTNGTLGLPEEAPFDAIVVTAGAEQLPPPYREQLTEGGRIVIPIGAHPRSQRMYRYTLVGGALREEDLGGFAFVPLIGEYGWHEEE